HIDPCPLEPFILERVSKEYLETTTCFAPQK
ncbi:MAG: hypothetical protein KR126chlam5_01330, partial [Candidatus Anoxychlamydiales bacterium]|nr:hypothetical protein [Candidatus Anoxychlamydiales bacterium]